MSDQSYEEPDESHSVHSILMADFSKGEQFWKFWTTSKVTLGDGEVVRIKVLSKRKKEGRFEVVCFTEIENGNKIIWAEERCATDAELVSFVRGIQVVVTHMVGLDAILEMMDFACCDTYDKWNYKFREGTTSKLWSSKDGSSVKGNM